MNDAILAILILLPVAITFFLKSNAALGFLAVCAAYSIESLAGGDIDTSISNLNLKGFSNADITLLILIVPSLLTLFFSSKSWAGQSKMIIHLLAAALAGLTLSIITAPFINSVASVNLYDSKIWPLIQHGRGSIVIVGTIYSLLIIWFSKTRHPDKKHKK